MTLTRLMLRSLCRFWRTNLGVMLGIALASTVITGALLVGDSAKLSLQAIALERLGETRLALDSGERFFSEAVADKLLRGADGSKGGASANPAQRSVVPFLKSEGILLLPPSDFSCFKD